MNNILLRLRVVLSLVLSVTAASSAAGVTLSGTYRSAPGTTGQYVYHTGEYHTVPVLVDVTMTFSGGNVTSTLSALIHKPIIGVDENGTPIFGIANEFPMLVTGTSSNGRDFHGDLLGTQYLFDWSIEPTNGGELLWNGNVGWAGGRVEVTTITNARLLPALAGDYDHDTTVSAADYVLWRKTLGQTGVGLASDGNGNGEVDTGDYEVWRTNFGASVGGPLTGNQSAIPEPACIALMIAGIAASAAFGRGSRRR